MKKVIALLLSLVLVIGCLSACSKKEDNNANNGNGGNTQNTENNNGGETTTTTPAETENQGSAQKELLRIEIYDKAANYQGVQTGWFAEVVKERFNLELNIIAPQVAGEAIYQTRVSTGNLGDIVILDQTEFNDCLSQGLIREITNEYKNSKYLKEFDKQIMNFNNGIPGNTEGKVYGFPTEMTNTSPTERSEDTIYSSPMLRWDLYQELGAPEIKDLKGLLDVLKQMKDAHPVNEQGDPCYPLVLWGDWDNNDNMLGIANVVQLTTWYGDKIKESAILQKDGTFTPVTDKNGSYYKMLKFLNDGYQMGLVDPDSATQDWNNVWAKMCAGQMYLMWYSWQVGAWNSQERINNGTAYIFVPVMDQTYYADADTYYGSGRIWGVGSGVSGEKYDRIMEFLDWYASPESLQFQHAGIEGFNYRKLDNGKYEVIPEHDSADADNQEITGVKYTGKYNDGNNKINQWIVGAISTNPNTGESYTKTYWQSYKDATNGKTKQEWRERFGASEPVEWMKKNNRLVINPIVSVSLPSDTADIDVKRSQCKQEIKDASWRMIFANDNASFDAMWDEMVANLNAFGFEDLYKFDVERAKIEQDAKNAIK
ncbi:MAG: sugar ABC transporter substrate-binding protein [Lachnospiraceae bacterium]|nr:sugar ABC transporter substrate-binding protein [Lachnospiraceae bacterium]